MTQIFHCSIDCDDEFEPFTAETAEKAAEKAALSEAPDDDIGDIRFEVKVCTDVNVDGVPASEVVTFDVELVKEWTVHETLRQE